MESTESDRVSVTVIQNVVSVTEKHHHTHFHSEPGRSRGKPVKVRIEIDQRPERSEWCERLRREHLKKVAEWEALFQQ